MRAMTHARASAGAAAMATSHRKAVRDVLARDSRPGRSASATVDPLMDLLYDGDFRIFEQVASTGEADFVNLIGVKAPPEGGEPLWLVSCVGTGDDPVPSHWRSTEGDPLAARVDADKGLLRGLGAASDKADAVLKLLAASELRPEELHRPVCVIALFGEEARGTGIEALLEGPAGRPEAALLGAPTNLEMWSAHPGCLVVRLRLGRRLRHRRMPPFQGIFDLRLEGGSAHAQAAGLGRDALEGGLELVERLRSRGDVRVLAFRAGEAGNRTPGRCAMTLATGYPELPPLPEGVEAEPVADGTSVPFPVDRLLRSWLRARDAGLARLGDRLGVAPGDPLARRAHTGTLATGRDEIVGTMALWTGRDVDQQALLDAFAEAARGAIPTDRDEQEELTVEVVHDRPAFQPEAPQGPLLTTARRSLEQVGLPTVLGAGPITTDAGHLARIGVPTLVFGPGRGPGDLYRDDEAVPLLHLDAAHAFYRQLLARWCGG